MHHDGLLAWLGGGTLHRSACLLTGRACPRPALPPYLVCNPLIVVNVHHASGVPLIPHLHDAVVRCHLLGDICGTAMDGGRGGGGRGGGKGVM